MSFFDWLFALNPLLILFLIFFAMIHSLASSRHWDPNRLGGPLSATLVAMVTLVVGLYIGQFRSALAGLILGLFLGVAIPLLKHMR